MKTLSQLLDELIEESKLSERYRYGDFCPPKEQECEENIERLKLAILALPV